MHVLVIEDKSEFVDAIIAMLAELPGPPNPRVARSRDAAYALLETEFFDLIVLDLRIPTKDGGFDDAPSHGHAVFARARSVAPGTPILVLTGSPVEDFVETLLEQKQDVDVWGENRKVMTVDILRKYEFEKCPAKLRPLAEAVRALADIELDRSTINLSIEDDRLIRIFARKNGGTRCIISRVGGGLSDALVLRIRITDAGGARVHDAVAKLGSPADVMNESERFDRYVSRLDAPATPRKLAMLHFGGRGRAAIFYGLADGFDQTAFEISRASEEQVAKAIKGVESATARWLEDVGQTRKTIQVVRRRNLSDAEAAKLLEKFPIPWAAEFEGREIQTRWACIHGDLHGSNVLLAGDGRAVVIDYGDVGEGPASLDPVTLELSAIFHPQGPLKDSVWPTLDQAKQWGDLESYLEGCPIPAFIRECRSWAARAAAGNREICASAYAYLLRQLKYEDTNKELALALLQGVKASFDAT